MFTHTFVHSVQGTTHGCLKTQPEHVLAAVFSSPQSPLIPTALVSLPVGQDSPAGPGLPEASLCRPLSDGAWLWGATMKHPGACSWAGNLLWMVERVALIPGAPECCGQLGVNPVGAERGGLGPSQDRGHASQDSGICIGEPTRWWENKPVHLRGQQQMT